jgi:hypothetical protein
LPFQVRSRIGPRPVFLVPIAKRYLSCTHPSSTAIPLRGFDTTDTAHKCRIKSSVLEPGFYIVVKLNLKISSSCLICDKPNSDILLLWPVSRSILRIFAILSDDAHSTQRKHIIRPKHLPIGLGGTPVEAEAVIAAFRNPLSPI